MNVQVHSYEAIGRIVCSAFVLVDRVGEGNRRHAKVRHQDSKFLQVPEIAFGDDSKKRLSTSLDGISWEKKTVQLHLACQ
ncbi:hypothetical protein KIN20_034995 [Parelaphostrongylus tenuis]|uniref:Uncharacterized protein n=1 Tax=Parelaphostrongylus tenuis TaxID=148309 RepID=A0AAD5RAY3_PARTN|nr:hypothetical protein KIN20_034995 [Parelaphostrongylus tenuis]